MNKLLGLLIFDHLNDVVYIRCNSSFVHHVETLAKSQGLLAPNVDSHTIGHNEAEQVPSLDPNVVVQLFSPLVTSQRIMGVQFNNSYTSICCGDGTTIVFQEYSNFLFLGIGTQSESYLQRFISVSIQMVQMTVGPCVSLLKSSLKKSKLLDGLLTMWLELFSKEQSYLVEAIERLVVSPEISSTSISVLSTILNKIKKCKDIGPGHAIFFVRNKLLALYSSKDAEELCGADLLSLNILVESSSADVTPFPCLNTHMKEEPASPTPEAPEEISEELDEREEEVAGDVTSDLSPEIVNDDFVIEPQVKEFNILLKTQFIALSPHLVYMYAVTSELSLVVVVEVNRSQLARNLYEVVYILESVKNEGGKFKEMQIIENVDNSLRKCQDLTNWLPKGVALKVKRNLLQASNRWESLKKNSLEEWLKSSLETELPSHSEASLSAVIETIRDTWKYVCLGITSPSALRQTEFATSIVKEKMTDFVPLLEQKALRNMPVGSCSILSINKYLEEFPGLVHFLYIDRSVHLLTAPVLWMSNGNSPEEHVKAEVNEIAASVKQLTIFKIWSMVDFAREHLSKGHTSLLWKDKTFSYSYFLWFEDQSGNPLKPITLDSDSLEELPLPGILCGDFYKAFASKAFPGIDPNRLRAYELLCIHLGLTTSPCILEQTRRLAATVWEIAGLTSTNPLDLL